MNQEEKNARWTNLATIVAVVLVAIVLWQHQKAFVVLAITLGVLIFVHELGHYLAARAVGVRVDEFALGFGPKLVTLFRSGPTVYNIRILPLGGFVSMAGMQPDDPDMPDGLNSKSAPARALVFAAGPIMNLLLALLILCLMGFTFGERKQWKVMVAAVTPNSVAQQMGLQPKDRVLRLDGATVHDPVELTELIEKGQGKTMELVVLRNGREVALHGAPKPEIDPTTHKKVFRFGFRPIGDFDVSPRLSLSASVHEGLAMFVQNFRDLGRIIATHKIRENVGGPIAMFQQTQATTQLHPLAHVELTCALSISLGVLNLLPIPILDGGHLMLLAIEVLQRRRLNPETVRAAQFFGLIVIAALFVFIMWNDISHYRG